MAVSNRPSLLILSFSRIAVDGRVLRQVTEFARDYDVTTCSMGEHPHPDVVEHLQLEADQPAWVRHSQGITLNLRWQWLVYNLNPIMREARRKLRGRTFDAVIVDDIPSMGAMSAQVPPERVLLDLHEYWPGIHDDNADWVRLRKPHFEWQLRKFGRRASMFTTVNEALADLYRENFGFDCRVVTNASTWQPDLAPQPVSDAPRYVHSGVAREARRIDLMMRAVDAASNGATLDLYLMGEGTEYYRALKQLESQLSDRVRIMPPVAHEKLLGVLNQYDVGLPFLPPTTTNIRNCLPNKFFDYVQARLAIVTGPTPPMASILEAHDLGRVSNDFTEESLVEAIEALDLDAITKYKQNAENAARHLSAEPQIRVWREMISNAVGQSGSGAKFS